MSDGAPNEMICTRLADMTVMHPDQAWQLCSQCGHAVGVYPTGQRAMERYPNMKLVCSVCRPIEGLEADATITLAGSVGEIVKEKNESKPVGKA